MASELLSKNLIGENIRAAREAMKWSQSDLGLAIKVSVQAISQWENGKTLPSIDNIMAAGAAMDVHPGVLLWGEKYAPDYDPSLPLDMGGSSEAVPIISWEAVPDLILADKRAEVMKRFVSGYLVPTTGHFHPAFALEVADSSMAPEFRKGDHILVEHSPRIDPGDIVVAIIAAGIGPPTWAGGPTVVLRKAQVRVQGKQQKAVYNLVAFNPDFPTIQIAGREDDGFIIGRVVEQRRYQHSITDLYGFDYDRDRYEEIVRRDSALK